MLAEMRFLGFLFFQFSVFPLRVCGGVVCSPLFNPAAPAMVVVVVGFCCVVCLLSLLPAPGVLVVVP